MSKIIPFSFPIKGVNRTLARSAQPDGTAYDLLNVLPYDVGLSRLRGGKRAGTVKQFPDPLTADAPVRLIGQVTTIVPGYSTFFREDFDYAAEEWSYSRNFIAGTLNLTQNRGWYVLTSSASENFGFHINGDGTGETDDVDNSGGSQSILAGRIVPALTASTPAEITSTFQFPTGQPPITDGTIQFLSTAVYLRQESTADSGGFRANLFTGIRGLLNFSRTSTGIVVNFANIFDLNTSTELSSYTFPTGTVFNEGEYNVLKLRLRSGVASLFLNGRLLTATFYSTGYDVNPGYGFAGNTTNDADTYPYAIRFDQVVTSIQDSANSSRQNNLIATCDGNIYQGDLSFITQTIGGSAVLDTDVFPQMAFSTGKAYFVDGSNLIQLDVPSATIEPYVETAGTAPPGCRLACVYRDRLVLAAPDTDPQNFFMSRVGDQHDWDYGADDEAAAFAGNASESGRIGEPIVSLIPASDDYLYIGGDHNLWLISGDPAAGGSIDLISDAIGLLGPNAWCKDPNGVIYFLGTGGFYKVSGKEIEEIAKDKWLQFFSAIDRTSNRITMAYDRDRYGLYIFVTPLDEGGTASVLWYDVRLDGFFPQAYPAAHGPMSSFVFDGDGDDDRKLLLGGRDGYIRSVSQTALTDDGTNISNYAVFGPFLIGDGQNDAITETLDLTFGAPGPWTALTATLRAGRTAFDAVDAAIGTGRAASVVYATAQVRPVPVRRRVRGAWFTLTIGNVGEGTWAFETAVLQVQSAGRTRKV